MTGFVYRLQLLLEQKEEARKEAEREVTRREERYQAEVQALDELCRQKTQLVERREQMRRDLFAQPGGTGVLSAIEIQRRTAYIKAMELHIQEADENIAAQRIVVEECQAEVDQAKQRANEARREAEVLSKHREKQKERFVREEQAKEELALDEIGNVLYTTRRRET
jgi:flagellar biosynthesis chaperone FliJ